MVMRGLGWVERWGGPGGSWGGDEYGQNTLYQILREKHSFKMWKESEEDT